MERAEFQKLRDLPNKRIVGDIKLIQRRATQPLLTMEGISIENDMLVELQLSIHYHPIVGSTVFNVRVPSLGPICRLCLGGSPHRPFGRFHKHSLQTSRCPDRNLPDGVVDMPELQGLSPAEAFGKFCSMANIVHSGTFMEPPVESVDAVA